MQKINIFDAHKNFNNLHKINIFFTMLLLHIIVENYYMIYLSEKKKLFLKNTYS